MSAAGPLTLPRVFLFILGALQRIWRGKREGRRGRFGFSPLLLKMMLLLLMKIGMGRSCNRLPTIPAFWLGNR